MNEWIFWYKIYCGIVKLSEKWPTNYTSYGEVVCIVVYVQYNKKNKSLVLQKDQDVLGHSSGMPCCGSQWEEIQEKMELT